MRHDAFVVAGLSLAAALSCSSHVPPGLGKDVVPGCDVGGSPFVKVKITLDKSGKTCKATVAPATVCVFRGGAVRFKVDNRCAELIRVGETALTITQPTPHARAAKEAAMESPKPWNFKICAEKFESLVDGDSDKNTMTCDVPDTVAVGTYKYGLGGQVEPLDPDIEVRKSH
jgi:hypothetical protein